MHVPRSRPSDASCLASLPAAGQVVTGPAPYGLHSIVKLFQAILNFLVFFFKTLLNPSAVNEYAQRNRRSDGSGGAPPKPGGPRGPRVTGLGDLRDAGGSESQCRNVAAGRGKLGRGHPST